MRVIRVSDYEELSLRSADLIASLIILKPDCVLGLATGGTPLGTYRDLIRLYREGRIDFSQVSSVNLDEYRGLKPNDPHSYRYFMDQNLFQNINIDPAHTFVPDGCESDPASACSKYDAIIDRFPLIDLQLLGLGGDGHIGFNEPSDCFIRRTHCVTLKEETIRANSRFFQDKAEVPHQAYTMGIADIMKASRILMIVSGSSKAAILRQVLEGPVTPAVPASVLHLHRNCTVIADEDALQCCDRLCKDSQFILP